MNNNIRPKRYIKFSIEDLIRLPAFKQAIVHLLNLTKSRQNLRKLLVTDLRKCANTRPSSLNEISNVDLSFQLVNFMKCFENVPECRVDFDNTKCI